MTAPLTPEFIASMVADADLADPNASHKSEEYAAAWRLELHVRTLAAECTALQAYKDASMDANTVSAKAHVAMCKKLVDERDEARAKVKELGLQVRQAADSAAQAHRRRELAAKEADKMRAELATCDAIIEALKNQRTLMISDVSELHGRIKDRTR